MEQPLRPLMPDLAGRPDRNATFYRLLRRNSVSFIRDSELASVNAMGCIALLCSVQWRLIQAVCWDVSNVSSLFAVLL